MMPVLQPISIPSGTITVDNNVLDLFLEISNLGGTYYFLSDKGVRMDIMEVDSDSITTAFALLQLFQQEDPLNHEPLSDLN